MTENFNKTGRVEKNQNEENRFKGEEEPQWGKISNNRYKGEAEPK